MAKMERSYHNDEWHLPDFIDLRDWQDDNAVLKNPHKGWYWHYIDNGFGSDKYRAEHDPDDALADFPGLNHLYLRFDWGDIEPTEGAFRFDRLYEIIEKWGARGFRFSMRACTFESATEGERANATPKFVYEAGAKYTVLPGGKREPDYGDPIYLKKLDAFMRALGREFNGHKLLETIDVGTFGTWGEGHSSFGSEKTWPYDVMKRHMDLHALYFPDTQILLNDDHINHRAPRAGQVESAKLLEYCKQLGFGLRDDSVSVDWYAERYGYDTLRTPYMFDEFYKYAPIDLELQHYHEILRDGGKYMRGGLPFVEAMRRTHATYAGFHGYPRPWLEMFPDITEYCANRLGYWYFIDGVQIPEMVSGAKNYIAIALENRGFAPCYTKYDARFTLANADRKVTLPVDIDNRSIAAGDKKLMRVMLNLRDVPEGEYDVSFGLFEGDKPIELGMKRELLDSGSYRVGCAKVSGV